jgi:signal transduction histidine kinase
MSDKSATRPSRRKTDVEKRGRTSDGSPEFKKHLRDKGINPALPWMMISSSGEILYAVPRMLSMLGIDRRNEVRFPVARENWEPGFHFFNEVDSKQAILEKILAKVAERKSLLTLTENRMKTFRLFLKPLSELGLSLKDFSWANEVSSLGSAKNKKNSAIALLFVEVLRAGDLLKDSQSRQALFRSFSHELRTSVMSLSGMIEMALASPQPGEQLKRMKESVKRIERIVDRLGELRARLGIEDSDLDRVQKDLKKV